MDVFLFFVFVPELAGVPSEPVSASTLLTLRYPHIFVGIDSFQTGVTKNICKSLQFT